MRTARAEIARTRSLLTVVFGQLRTLKCDVLTLPPAERALFLGALRIVERRAHRLRAVIEAERVAH